jgi:hypothetical protein
MIDDHGEVPLPLAVTDLVNPDPPQTSEQIALAPALV